MTLLIALPVLLALGYVIGRRWPNARGVALAVVICGAIGAALAA